MIIRIGAVVALSGAVAACTPRTPAQHEVACVGGTLAGAALGGAIGNRFGGGRGQTLMTAAGVFAGGATTAVAMDC